MGALSVPGTLSPAASLGRKVAASVGPGFGGLLGSLGGGWMSEPPDSWRVGGTWRQGQEARPGGDLGPGPAGVESFSFATWKVSTRMKGSSFPLHLS